MKDAIASIVTYGLVFIGIKGMTPEEFKPTVFFFFYVSIIIIAMMVGYYFETEGWDKIKNRCKKWLGV